MNPTSPVRCVAFDVVGTLLYPEPAVARVYAQIGARHGSGRTETEVAARFQQAMGIFSRDFSEHGGRTSEEHERSLWREVVAGVLDDVPCIDECYADLFAWFSRSEAWRVFEDVAPAVHALQAGGVAIALASNFDSRLHAVCEGFPVLRDLRVRAVSSELGYRKPHRIFYESLVQLCGVPAADILMVGDTPEVDVIGARAAGLRAVLIDRDSEAGLPERISSLVQVSELGMA